MKTSERLGLFLGGGFGLGALVSVAYGFVAFNAPTTDPQGLGPAALVVLLICAALPFCGLFFGSIAFGLSCEVADDGPSIPDVGEEVMVIEGKLAGRTGIVLAVNENTEVVLIRIQSGAKSIEREFRLSSIQPIS